MAKIKNRSSKKIVIEDNKRVHPEFLTKFENRNITLSGKCDII